MLEVCKWQSTWGYQVEKDDWEKNLHINPKRHKNRKFQWQYEEYEKQIYTGMAVQPSLFMLKKDEFKLDVVKTKLLE